MVIAFLPRATGGPPQIEAGAAIADARRTRVWPSAMLRRGLAGPTRV